jgi:hypothetical protein
MSAELPVNAPLPQTIIILGLYGVPAQVSGAQDESNAAL